MHSRIWFSWPDLYNNNNTACVRCQYLHTMKHLYYECVIINHQGSQLNQMHTCVMIIVYTNFCTNKTTVINSGPNLFVGQKYCYFSMPTHSYFLFLLNVCIYHCIVNIVQGTIALCRELYKQICSNIKYITYSSSSAFSLSGIGTSDRVFNLHVLRFCASSIYLFLFQIQVFSLPIFRCPPTSMFSLLSYSVFLSTWPNHNIVIFSNFLTYKMNARHTCPCSYFLIPYPFNPAWVRLVLYRTIYYLAWLC